MHVVECFGGGVIQSISKLCYFLEGDAELIVVYSEREQTPENFESFYPEGVTFIKWDSCRAINPVKDFKAALQLRKFVKQHKPDVLHLHSSKAGAIGRLAFPLGGGIKILYTPRAYGFLQLDITPAKRFIYWAIERVLGVFPHITVACGMGEYMLSKKLARQQTVICNAISTERLDKLAQNKKDFKKFTVSSAGRISPQKNFPLFAELAGSFEAQGVDFLWIGGGDIPEEISIPKNLKLTGWMDYEDCIAHMSGSDVYIQPSLWEGLSLTMLEAMGLGLPVVSSDAVGNKEMIKDGVDGFVCSDKASYIDVLSKLVEDESLRKSLGQAARHKAETEYGMERCQNAWKEMYLSD